MNRRLGVGRVGKMFNVRQLLGSKVAAVIAGLGLALSVSTTNAATISATGVTLGSGDSSFSWTVNYLCTAGTACHTDGTNITDVTLSASAVFTLDGFVQTVGTTVWDFTVAMTNTTPVATTGTNRISSFGFASDPDATIGGVDNTGAAYTWVVGSGAIPGFSGVELCAYLANNCQSAGGGATVGIQETETDTFGFTLTVSSLVNSITLDNNAIKFSSAGAGDAGSYEFAGIPEQPGTGGPPPVVPLPAGLPLMLSALGIAALVRRKSRKAA